MPKDATCTRELSVERQAANLSASRALAVAIAATCGAAALARKLGVSHTQVGHWCDPEHPAAFTLRDLRCAPISLRRAILTAELALVDEAVNKRESMKKRARALIEESMQVLKEIEQT